jgi:YggT family protein
VNDTIASIFSLFIWFLLICVFLRALMSWFPVRQDNQFIRLLDTVTEPLIDPVRRVVPRIGMIDISSMVVIVVLYVMLQVIQIAADQ